MKKIIIRTGLFTCITFMFLSCNDEFLERFPEDRISMATFWNSENDMRVYNNSLYNSASGNAAYPLLVGHSGDQYSASNRATMWGIDAQSDNLVQRGGVHVILRAGKLTIPASNYESGDVWDYATYGNWGLVRAINIGLANYDRVNATQDVKDKYIGEARLLRGWWYAQQVQRYGDYEWIDKELNIDSEELFGSRKPREEIMDNVLADLNFACDGLPSDWGDGNNPGRLNRWAALAVKSRVCLFEGTWRKYHGGTSPDTWLQAAADAAKELIEDGPYTLYSKGDTAHNYNDLHRAPDLTGSMEVINYRAYSFALGIYNNVMYGYGWSTTKSMVEDYLCTDGLPISLSPLYLGDANYEDLFENRDPRLRQTVLHPDDQPFYNLGLNPDLPFPRVSGLSGTTSPSGYHVIKCYNASTAGVGYNQGETPAIILRLSEALLNYAEAQAELGTITQADLDMSINKLRDRVGMPHMDLTNIPVDPRYTGDGVSPLIVEIRRERRVELFMEGFRRLDLMRWKQGKKLENPDLGMRWDDAAKAMYDPDGIATVHTKMDGGVPYIDVMYGTDFAAPVFDENKDYLYPIPLNVIALNPNIGQNPGWE